MRETLLAAVSLCALTEAVDGALCSGAIRALALLAGQSFGAQPEQLQQGTICWPPWAAILRAAWAVW
jgi:hypothetical protein